VHAGWRGAAGGIAVRAVDLIRNTNPVGAAIDVFLGPAVSGPRYQVGGEVIEALRSHGVAEDLWLDGRHVDLRNFLAGQLERWGVTSVVPIGGCTVESADLASYRRDGERAGRQWSLVYRAVEGPAASL
jgi:copper oxidase (laccase) domain-containing protein